MEAYLKEDECLASQAATDDRDILDNINGRIHGPIPGFMERHFANFPFVVQGGETLLTYAAERIGGHSAIPSGAPSPDKFVQWFSSHVSQELDGARGLWHISQDSGHESTEDSAHILLTMSPCLVCTAATIWDHVQVIGRFYQRGCVYQDGLLNLCRSAHQVFASQPTRLFLHGFYIRGSLAELWVFDRSGLYCSRILDLAKDFAQFLSVINSYRQMTDQDLGNLDIIQVDADGSYMMIDGAQMPSPRKIYLEGEPIASSGEIVGEGATCYRARMPESTQWNSILKFKWRWAIDRPENELLEVAEKKCVWGAVSLDYYKELESTANLRRGLRWGPQRQFITHRVVKEQGGKVDYKADGCSDYTEEIRITFRTVSSPAP